MGTLLPFSNVEQLRKKSPLHIPHEGEIVAHCGGKRRDGNACNSGYFVLYPDGTPACAVCGTRPTFPDPTPIG